MLHTARPLGHVWYQKLDQVVSSLLQPSTAAFVAAKVQSNQTLLQTHMLVAACKHHLEACAWCR